MKHRLVCSLPRIVANHDTGPIVTCNEKGTWQSLSISKGHFELSYTGGVKRSFPHPSQSHKHSYMQISMCHVTCTHTRRTKHTRKHSSARCKRASRDRYISFKLFINYNVKLFIEVSITLVVNVWGVGLLLLMWRRPHHAPLHSHLLVCLPPAPEGGLYYTHAHTHTRTITQCACVPYVHTHTHENTCTMVPPC